MYIFGGYDGRARYNDLYKFKLRNKKYVWKKIEAEGTVPLNRFAKLGNLTTKLWSFPFNRFNIQGEGGIAQK